MSFGCQAYRHRLCLHVPGRIKAAVPLLQSDFAGQEERRAWAHSLKRNESQLTTNSYTRSTATREEPLQRHKPLLSQGHT